MEVQCDKCNILFKATDTDLTSTEIKVLQSKKRCLKFICETCENKSEEIKELKEMVTKLQLGLEEIKINLGKAKEKNEEEKLSEMESMIQEIHERKLRERNVIIYDVKESRAKNKMERIEYDKQEVMKILEPIGSVKNDEIKVYRLGSQDNTKRPMKVILNSKEKAINILKNNKLIHDHKIASDKTVMQQKYMKIVQERFADRKNKGETDIIIKYVKGTPTIIDKEKANSAKN